MRTQRHQPRRYAEGTVVPVNTSKQEIDRLLRVHGASAIATVWDQDRYAVVFEMKGRRVRLNLIAPEVKKFPSTQKFEREERRRWRVMLIMLKMKLEVVESGDAEFDQEFLSYMVLPDGRTSVGQRVIEQLVQVCEGQPLRPLLGGG